MATTWQEYRASLRSSVLKLDAKTVADAVLLDAAKWAFNDLCAHTAFIADQYIDSSTINPDTNAPYDLGADTEFKLDYNPYPTVYDARQTMAVFVNDVLVDRNNFGVDYDGYLILKAAPSGPVRIVYYAYYPYPINDTDVLAIPQWAESIVKHRILSHVLIPLSVEAAEIGQYDGPRDKGNPEDNPLMKVQEWQEKMYKLLLEKIPEQQRKPLWQA